MNIYYLVTELSGTVVAEGTKEQCQFAWDALTAYGIRADKFEIISDLCEHCNESICIDSCATKTESKH